MSPLTGQYSLASRPTDCVRLLNPCLRRGTRVQTDHRGATSSLWIGRGPRPLGAVSRQGKRSPRRTISARFEARLGEVRADRRPARPRRRRFRSVCRLGPFARGEAPGPGQPVVGAQPEQASPRGLGDRPNRRMVGQAPKRTVSTKERIPRSPTRPPTPSIGKETGPRGKMRFIWRKGIPLLSSRNRSNRSNMKLIIKYQCFILDRTPSKSGLIRRKIGLIIGLDEKPRETGGEVRPIIRPLRPSLDHLKNKIGLTKIYFISVT
jgi:hypothetical protein